MYFKKAVLGTFVLLAFIKQIWANTYYLNYLFVTGIIPKKSGNRIPAISVTCKYDYSVIIKTLTLLYHIMLHKKITT